MRIGPLSRSRRSRSVPRSSSPGPCRRAHAGPSGRGPPARRAGGSHARVRRHAPALLPALAGPRRSPGPDAALHRPVPVPRERPALEPAPGVPAAVRCPSPPLGRSAATPPTTCSSCSRFRRPPSPPTAWRAGSPATPIAARRRGRRLRAAPGASSTRSSAAIRPGFALALVPALLWGLDVALTRRTARRRRRRGLALVALAMLEPQYTYHHAGDPRRARRDARLGRANGPWAWMPLTAFVLFLAAARRLGLHAASGVRHGLDRRRRAPDR